MGKDDVTQTGEDWIVATPVDGVHVVRFLGRLLIHENCARGFLAKWNHMLHGVGDAEVLVLNFAQVECFTAQFLGCLMRTYAEPIKRRARIVGCQLN
jgi:hypothetical protein